MDRGTKEPNLAEGWGKRRAEDAENLVIEHCETGSQVAWFEKNKKGNRHQVFFFFFTVYERLETKSLYARRRSAMPKRWSRIYEEMIYERMSNGGSFDSLFRRVLNVDRYDI